MSAWRTIRAELQRLVGTSAYEIWLAPIELESFDGDVLMLRAPKATEKWLAGRFGPVLERCVRQILGAHTRVTFAGEERARPSHEPRAGRAGPDGEPTELNPRYRFEQFVIGEGNRLAHAAALAVAELPGQAYNPLFLYAPPGLGKTHLLHAIGNYVLDYGGGATVRYTTAEAFTNHFITALSTKSIDAFKHAYRDADVLLIDDIQFLASKVRTEEEFFHTFNALYETGRQLVLTCDRLPRALVSIEQRLRERFEAGLVADIKPPDPATRVTILRKRAAVDNVTLADPAVLDLIADRVPDNIRALEGAFIRVVAFHSLTQRPIDRALTLDVLDAMYPVRLRSGPPSIVEVQAIVAAHFKLSVEQLTSPSRTSAISWPRQVAIHLVRDLTDASLPTIGQAFGGRNHATVLHACRRVSERLKNDQQVVDEIARLSALVSAHQADRDC
ncbi:MAG TPA: chromosomal replication initiator protein DnaA [Solirubrobacteraceae bacterium]|nr:chromosomal replication initiator protein DnaA [Solirubrobacteraceae bacterium]